VRRFELHRDEDVSGVSGTGVVAEGVAFSNDGPVALRWTSEWPTSVVFHDRGVESLEAVHGHNGRTRIVWLDGDDQRSLGDEAALSVLTNAIGWIVLGGEPGDSGYDGRIEASADELALVRRAAARGVAHLSAYLGGEALT
jgi:hypothetical protein